MGGRRGTAKGEEETFRGNGYVHFLNRDSGFKDVCKWYVLNMCSLLHTLIKPFKKKRKKKDGQRI